MIAPFLLAAFAALLDRAGPRRACAMCGSATDDAIPRALYGLGFRRFCVPVNDREAVSLRLARAGIGVS